MIDATPYTRALLMRSRIIIQNTSKYMVIIYYIIQLEIARATAYLHKMGCCGLIQSEIEKHYLKGKFDKMIILHITYLLYACSAPFQNCTVDCTVPVVIENNSE